MITTPAFINQPAIIVEPDATIAPSTAGYFADYSAWSQSMLKTFLERRRLAEAYYITKSAVEPEPTDPMRKGTAVHTALLEPEKFDDLIRIYPANILAKNGAVSTNEAYAFRDEHEAAGRMVFKEKDVVAIREVAKSVRRKCGEWIDAANYREHEIRWIDDETGLPCKMRLDLLWVQDSLHILDLKAVTDPSPQEFQRAIDRQMYWFQDAHYSEGVRKVFGQYPSFGFIAAETKFPYTTAIHCIKPRERKRARRERRRVVAAVAECIRTGDWSERWEEPINELSVSEWSYSQGD